jgi:hypothetical protein
MFLLRRRRIATRLRPYYGVRSGRDRTLFCCFGMARERRATWRCCGRALMVDGMGMFQTLVACPCMELAETGRVGVPRREQKKFLHVQVRDGIISSGR